ncbi:MAG TPA: hypothetical protein DDY43_15210 [Synechococcales bacterium UBA10510]|nr:hypothetical protein [Synechococcales bacterium UBA10510]
MLLVKRLIDGLLLLLIGYVGLHLPRSFLLLYLFVVLVFLRATFVQPDFRALLKDLNWVKALRPALFLLLFSIAYCLGMLAWGFWSLPKDAQDVFNALFLPPLLFLAGTQAASFRRLWSTRLLLSYALGGLIYLLVALFLAREHWWSWSEVFPVSISVPWGSSAEINVRSVEQNGYSALLLLAPGLLLLFGSVAASSRFLGVILLALSACGAHVVWALQGRLAWLALLLSTVPVAFLLAKRMVGALFSSSSFAWRTRFIFTACFAAALGIGISLLGHLRSLVLGISAEGFCDERLFLFASMLGHLHQAPWGGRLLEVPVWNCGGQPLILSAAKAGALNMAHNVLLDIYFTVGFLPLLLLLGALASPVLAAFRGFVCSWPFWDWQISLRWSWLCFLACQWMLQPLQYSDGLLYYFSFFILGLFLVEGRRGFNDA